MLAAAVGDLAHFECLDMRLEPEALEQTLTDCDPDVICLTALTMDVPEVIRIIQKIREHEVEALICVGGEHATFLPKTFEGLADIVFCGRAVTSFKKFLIDIKRSNFVPSDTIVIKSDPTYEFVNPDRSIYRQYWHQYVYGAMFDISLATFSVGCPYRCTYCSIPGSEGAHITQPIDEFLAGIERTQSKNILLTDANFLANRREVTFLLRELSKARAHNRFMASFRSDTIVRHPELAEQMASAGVVVGAMGLESFSSDQLTDWDKGTTTDQNREAVTILKSNGMMVRGNFVIDQGFDTKSFESLSQEIEELGIDFPTFQILTPLPGSLDFAAQFPQCVTKNFGYFDLSHSVLQTTRMSAWDFHQEFQELFKKSYSNKRLFQLARKMPLRTSIRAASLALKARTEMTYENQTEFFEAHS